MLSNNARISYLLGGNPASAPDKIESTELIADFGADNIQANVTASSWTFANADAVSIKAWIAAGRIYEGLPFKINVYNNSNTLVAFDGLLDLTDNYEDRFSDEVRVKCNMVKASGSNIFFNQLSAISFAFLEDQGVFTNSDYSELKYVVEKKINLLDELIIGVVLYMMVKEVIERIKSLPETTANAVAHATGGAIGPIASAVYVVVVVALDIAYTIALIAVIIKLAKQLFETLLPPLRTHKVLRLKTAMEKVVEHLGYTFNTTITDLDTLYYLPSNPQLESESIEDFLTVDPGTDKGIPRITDPHYKCANFFELMKKMFNAKFSVINNVVQFHTESAPYWINTASYQIPIVRPNYTTTNASDLNASTVISFAYDLSDEYTVDNYTGTTYEIQTVVQNLPTDSVNLLKGFQDISLDVCLGTRKTELMSLERALVAVASVLDSIINTFGGNSTYAAQVVNNKIGVLKQTSNWHSLPKIVMLTGNKLPANYRNVFSAKVLYDNYHSFDSFTLNNFNGQKELHKDIRIPFGMADFVTLINNSYCTDSNGANAKIMSIKWKVTEDYAIIDYWVRNVFTQNLVETYIEP